jgi:hypothetical protein
MAHHRIGDERLLSAAVLKFLEGTRPTNVRLKPDLFAHLFGAYNPYIAYSIVGVRVRPRSFEVAKPDVSG